MVVVGKSNKDAFVEFLCIHHSTEPQNDRQLEQDAKRGPEDKIICRRKRRESPMN
jgi:hypothetical protein